MIRFPGNNVAKNFRVYRHCSSTSEKEVPMGDLELFVDNMAGLFFKAAYGVVGFVLGGLTSNSVSKEVQKDEEALIKLKQNNDEREMNMELMRKNRLERNRKYFSTNVYAFEGEDTSV